MCPTVMLGLYNEEGAEVVAQTYHINDGDADLLIDDNGDYIDWR